MLTKRGIVTSAKMTGTVTVTVHRRKPHPLYRKSFRVSKKFLVDARGLELGVGDHHAALANVKPSGYLILKRRLEKSWGD